MKIALFILFSSFSAMLCHGQYQLELKNESDFRGLLVQSMTNATTIDIDATSTHTGSASLRFLRGGSLSWFFSTGFAGDRNLQLGRAGLLDLELDFTTGDVAVTNMLSKGGGSFKIDHPLHPQTMYLYHSFVESPDMLNVYNGNVITDAEGYGIVELPDYFEALNKDYRYQLTAIGNAAHVYVFQEVIDNQFIIHSSVPETKVSWQVTGVRNDFFAQQNRVEVEVEKEELNKGRFLHPRFPDQERVQSSAVVLNPVTSQKE